MSKFESCAKRISGEQLLPRPEFPRPLKGAGEFMPAEMIPLCIFGFAHCKFWDNTTAEAMPGSCLIMCRSSTEKTVILPAWPAAPSIDADIYSRCALARLNNHGGPWIAELQKI